MTNNTLKNTSISTGQATVIDVDLMIRSMGPVSEIDMVSNEN
jgi:hypothetical protein